MMFADISKEAFTRKKNISQHQIISICQRTIIIINYAQEGASLISKQGEVKKKNAYLFQQQGRTNKMDSDYLENYV